MRKTYLNALHDYKCFLYPPPYLENDAVHMKRLAVVRWFQFLPRLGLGGSPLACYSMSPGRQFERPVCSFAILRFRAG